MASWSHRCWGAVASPAAHGRSLPCPSPTTCSAPVYSHHSLCPGQMYKLLAVNTSSSFKILLVRTVTMAPRSIVLLYCTYTVFTSAAAPSSVWGGGCRWLGFGLELSPPPWIRKIRGRAGVRLSMPAHAPGSAPGECATAAGAGRSFPSAILFDGFSPIRVERKESIAAPRCESRVGGEKRTKTRIKRDCPPWLVPFLLRGAQREEQDVALSAVVGARRGKSW
jgi:hypothetical protein